MVKVMTFWMCKTCGAFFSNKDLAESHTLDVDRLEPSEWVSLDEIKKALDEFKVSEDDGLNALPFDVAMKLQSGYLMGYADLWTKIYDRFPIEEYVGDKIMKTMNKKRGGD